MVGDPDIVGAGPVVCACLICWDSRGERQLHVVCLNEIEEGLDQVGWGVEVTVGLRFPKRVVAVEVAEPDHDVVGGRMGYVRVRDEVSRQDGGGIVVVAVIVDIDER